MCICLEESKRYIILFYFSFFFHLSISCFVILISDSQALELTNKLCCDAVLLFTAVCVKMWKCWIVLPYNLIVVFLSHFFHHSSTGFSLNDSTLGRGCISEYVFCCFSIIFHRLFVSLYNIQHTTAALVFFLFSTTSLLSPNRVFFSYIFFLLCSIINMLHAMLHNIDIGEEKLTWKMCSSKSVWVELWKIHNFYVKNYNRRLWWIWNFSNDNNNFQLKCEEKKCVRKNISILANKNLFSSHWIMDFGSNVFFSFIFLSRWRKAELLFLLSTTIALNREKLCSCTTHLKEEKRKMFPIVCTIVSEEKCAREWKKEKIFFREIFERVKNDDRKRERIWNLCCVLCKT